MPVEWTASFDGCFSQDALVHAYSKGVALTEAFRITRPGGFLVLCDLNCGPGEKEAVAEAHTPNELTGEVFVTTSDLKHDMLLFDTDVVQDNLSSKQLQGMGVCLRVVERGWWGGQGGRACVGVGVSQCVYIYVNTLRDTHTTPCVLIYTHTSCKHMCIATNVEQQRREQLLLKEHSSDTGDVLLTPKQKKNLRKHITKKTKWQSLLLQRAGRRLTISICHTHSKKRKTNLTYTSPKKKMAYPAVEVYVVGVVRYVIHSRKKKKKTSHTCTSPKKMAEAAVAAG